MGRISKPVNRLPTSHATTTDSPATSQYNACLIVGTRHVIASALL